MERWLQFAADYICDWLEFQLRASQQPGLIVALARGEILVERAFGVANLDTGEKLSAAPPFPDHIIEKLYRCWTAEAARTTQAANSTIPSASM